MFGPQQVSFEIRSNIEADLSCVLSLRGGAGVALKIIKNLEKYKEAARLEINVLERIRESDPDSRQ